LGNRFRAAATWVAHVDLSAKERVEAIRQLASSGLGVREISRGTGLAPSTISRWIRIAGNQPLAQAMAEGRVDIFRAMQPARVQDPERVEELIGDHGHVKVGIHRWPTKVPSLELGLD
jgi:transposase-like protein